MFFSILILKMGCEKYMFILINYWYDLKKKKKKAVLINGSF